MSVRGANDAPKYKGFILPLIFTTIEIGDTSKNPKFRDKRGKLRTFDCVVANWSTRGDCDTYTVSRRPAIREPDETWEVAGKARDKASVFRDSRIFGMMCSIVASLGDL